MKARIAVATLSVALLSACPSKPQPDEVTPVEPQADSADVGAVSAPAAPEAGAPNGSCMADDDCALTTTIVSGEEACCTSCSSNAWNAEWLSAFEAQCAEGAADRSCPLLRCSESPDEVAKCVEGTCQTEAVE